MKFGKCRLNYNLFKINLHPNGKCDICNENETIEHYLINCAESKTGETIRTCCQLNQMETKLEIVLKNNRLMEQIAEIIDRDL